MEFFGLFIIPRLHPYAKARLEKEKPSFEGTQEPPKTVYQLVGEGLIGQPS